MNALFGEPISGPVSSEAPTLGDGGILGEMLLLPSGTLGNAALGGGRGGGGSSSISSGDESLSGSLSCGLFLLPDFRGGGKLGGSSRSSMGGFFVHGLAGGGMLGGSSSNGFFPMGFFIHGLADVSSWSAGFPGFFVQGLAGGGRPGGSS